MFVGLWGRVGTSQWRECQAEKGYTYQPTSPSTSLRWLSRNVWKDTECKQCWTNKEKNRTLLMLGNLWSGSLYGGNRLLLEC